MRRAQPRNGDGMHPRELGIGQLRQEQSGRALFDHAGSNGVEHSGGTACLVMPQADHDLIAVFCKRRRVCILEGHPCADLIAHIPNGERERPEHRRGNHDGCVLIPNPLCHGDLPGCVSAHDRVSAIAEAAIKRIAKLYAVEKLARGKSPEERVATRQKHAKDIFDDLEDWLQAQLPKISGKSPLAQAIRYALGRLPKARPYLENGVLEADNNSVERAMKPVAIGRKNWTFAGSEGGGRAMAIAYTLIETAKLNSVDPQAWLTDVLGRIADHKITRLEELMPWRYAQY